MDLYRSGGGMESRWSSFESLSAAKGRAAMENKGGKGHAFDHLMVGETKTLLNIEGSGTIRRMWFTIGPRSTAILRSLKLDIYWDGCDKPAVSVPFGDFFGFTMGTIPPAFENELFASAEARSFVCYIPMPFRKGARVTLTNESPTDLKHLFFDINLTVGDKHDDDVLYFHSHWRRERWTKCGVDFEILPKIKGVGRFVGSHIGVLRNPAITGWWGEGEIKMYLDGDSEFPTLAGTGTEDYISTAWGQGVFANRFSGSFVADNDNFRYSFYRYHIPDPVFFYKDCRVAMQQIGGTMKGEVAGLVKQGLGVKPVTMDESDGFGFRNFLDLPEAVDLDDPSLPEGWVNFYREDDWSATAFFYVNVPTTDLPTLPSVEKRMEGIDW